VYYAKPSDRPADREITRCQTRAEAPGTLDRRGRRNVTAVAEAPRVSRRRSGRRITREIGLGVRAVIQRTVLGTPRVDVRPRSRVHRRCVTDAPDRATSPAERDTARGVRDGAIAARGARRRQIPRFSTSSEISSLLSAILAPVTVPQCTLGKNNRAAAVAAPRRSGARRASVTCCSQAEASVGSHRSVLVRCHASHIIYRYHVYWLLSDFYPSN